MPNAGQRLADVDGRGIEPQDRARVCAQPRQDGLRTRDGLEPEQILAGAVGVGVGGGRGLGGQHLGQERRGGEHRVALPPHGPVHRDHADLYRGGAEKRAEGLERLLRAQAAHAARGERGQPLRADLLGHPRTRPQPPVDAERGSALARSPVGERVEEGVGGRVGADEGRAQHPGGRREEHEEVERRRRRAGGEGARRRPPWIATRRRAGRVSVCTSGP